MKLKEKKTTTGFRNGDLFCFNCGESFNLQLPQKTAFAADVMTAFHKNHKNCPKTWTEPVNEAETKSERENEMWWLTNGEHGISSKTMFYYLTDSKIVAKPDRTDTPSDPDDFRRCHLLLQAIPQYEHKLDRLRAVNAVWAALVDNWPKLTEMLLERMKTRKANGMYEFMKQIGC